MIDRHIEEELLAAYALDTIEDGEASLVRDHLLTCEACQIQLAEIRSLFALLPEGVDDVAPPAGLQARILAEAVGSIQNAMPVAAQPVVRLPERPRSFAPRQLLAIAAALFVGAVLGAALWSAIRPSSGSDDLDGLLQAIAGGDSIVLPMNGTAEAPDVRAALVVRPEADIVHVLASNVPALPAGQAYHLYLYENGQPVHAASFLPDEDGKVNAVLNVDFDRFEAMEVDIQALGTTTPGGTAVLKSSLP